MMKQKKDEGKKSQTLVESLGDKIKGMPKAEGLDVVSEELEGLEGHIKKHAEELKGLEPQREAEKAKRNKKMAELRTSYVDTSPGGLVDQLLKITKSKEMRHLDDSLDKIRTNLAFLNEDRKDLIRLRDGIKHEIKEKAEDEKVIDLSKLMKEVAEKINEAEASYFLMKERAIQISLGDPQYGARANRMKFPEWITQVMSMSGFNASALPGLTMQAFARMISAFPGNPLAEERKYQRGETVKKTGHILDSPRSETVRGQVDADQQNLSDTELENAIGDVFKMPVLSEQDFTQ